jgi:hypothetical protein
MPAAMESADDLRKTYIQMTEEELRRVAEDAFDLMPVAKQALQSVIAEKGFKIQLREAPPREEPQDVGDSEDYRHLNTICQLKSEADARRAKGILDAKFIASCLGPDNIADLEKFKGSFAGGVDLKVFSQDRLHATWMLNEYAPDLMGWDDGIPEDECELDHAVTCPKCQSEDIVFEEGDAQPEDGAPLHKFRWSCAACGHQWQDEGISHIVNNNERGHSSSSD